MKITKIVTGCDLCRKEASANTCVRCGKCYCFNCTAVVRGYWALLRLCCKCYDEPAVKATIKRHGTAMDRIHRACQNEVLSLPRPKRRKAVKA